MDDGWVAAIQIEFSAQTRLLRAHAPFQISNLAHIYTQCLFERSRFKLIQLSSNLLSKRHQTDIKWQELEKLSVRPDNWDTLKTISPDENIITKSKLKWHLKYKDINAK